MAGLLRWQVFASYAVVFLAVWSFAWSSTSENDPNMWIDFAPLWAIVALGVYAVSSVLYGVATFRDCPEAATEIEQQVVEAKKELKRRGIIS